MGWGVRGWWRREGIGGGGGRLVGWWEIGGRVGDCWEGGRLARGWGILRRVGVGRELAMLSEYLVIAGDDVWRIRWGQ